MNEQHRIKMLEETVMGMQQLIEGLKNISEGHQHNMDKYMSVLQKLAVVCENNTKGINSLRDAINKK